MINLSKHLKNYLKIPFEYSQIEILSKPTEYYQKLCQLCIKSTTRIHISSLYIGNDLKCQNFIKLIENQLIKKNLKIDFTLDKYRSLRQTSIDNEHDTNNDIMKLNKKTSMNIYDLLANILSNKEQIQLNLINNHINKDKSMLTINKLKELQSVHHIKCYIFDNTIVITNLI